MKYEYGIFNYSYGNPPDDSTLLSARLYLQHLLLKDLNTLAEDDWEPLQMTWQTTDDPPLFHGTAMATDCTVTARRHKQEPS